MKQLMRLLSAALLLYPAISVADQPGTVFAGEIEAVHDDSSFSFKNNSHIRVRLSSVIVDAEILQELLLVEGRTFTCSGDIEQRLEKPEIFDVNCSSKATGELSEYLINQGHATGIEY